MSGINFGLWPSWGSGKHNTDSDNGMARAGGEAADATHPVQGRVTPLGRAIAGSTPAGALAGAMKRKKKGY
jgi:hypothetical protein